MSARGEPGSATGVALLVLNVAGVPGLIKSTDNGTSKGRMIGYGLALAVGGASSVLTRSPWPMLGSAAMCALMRHLQNDHDGGAGDVPAPVDTTTRVRAWGRDRA